MVWVRVICAVLVAATTFQTAKAQSACESINDVVETVALVRTLQTAQGDRDQIGALMQLDNNVRRMSVDPILSAAALQALPTEAHALNLYVDTLESALVQARAGQGDIAKQIVISALAGEAASAISAFGDYWECRPQNAENAALPDIASDAASKTPGSTDSTAASDRWARSVAEGSDVRDRSGERSGLSGGYYGRDAVVGSNSMMGLIVMGAMALVGGFVVAWRRRRSKNAREARKVLNRSISARINGEISDLVLIDLSMNGAKLQHFDTLEGTEKIDIQLSGRWHAAQMKWCNPLFAGIMFRKAIDMETMEAIGH